MASTSGRKVQANDGARSASPTSSRGNPGNGGETHQTSQATGCPFMTSAQGIPVADNQNSLKVGPRGPVALSDFQMREKIFHFDHERIPERVVHARGVGAHGFFESYGDLSDLTMAEPLQKKNQRTPAFVRFSTVAGSLGSPDLARDVRGFAVKLYSQQGNWDIVGNNIPVFFIQDAIKFPDLIHAAKPEPDRGFPQAQTAHDNFWDFISLMPESMHMVMWIMSDRTIPRSLRFMEGFGVHTFRLINKAGKSTYAKFHWKPKQGMQSVVWNEAVKINGADPDFHRRDLWEAIRSGDCPEWELGVQLFDDDFADSFEFDILDATKIIPEERVPIRMIGRLVLDRCVDNFFAETEQVAFCTQNVIPGIGFTNDPLLQGRNFSYLDTQLKRLGSTNFTHIPINAPKCPVANFLRDGHMTTVVPTGRANYEPNSWPTEEAGPRETSEGYQHFPAAESGEMRKVRAELFADHYSQARQFYESQTEVEQAHIASALIFELSKVKTLAIRMRTVSHLRHISESLCQEVAEGLALGQVPDAPPPAREPIGDLPLSDALSILKNPPPSIAGRRFGVFVTDGFPMNLMEALTSQAKRVGATVKLVAPKIGGVTCSDGMLHEADEKIDGGPSVLFDFVVLLADESAAQPLVRHAPLLDFIKDAYAHCKFIAYTPGSRALLEAAGVAPDADEGIRQLSSDKDVKAFLGACASLRFWARERQVAVV